jgi:LmbE family N-acetylglucosaminyl deacetylase
MEVHMISLKSVIINCLFTLMIGIGNAKAALFITAHPDDVAYLMNRNAQIDVRGNYPTVFVCVTAGDASNGAGLGGNTRNTAYYRARLRAYEYYVHFWQGIDSGIWAPAAARGTQTIAGKSVETVKMGNVVMYFLNLPDNGSLIQLSAGTISSVTSISPVNIYTLPQLKDVIREIIRINNRSTPTINLNTQDPDTDWNPGDHTDHVATGRIVDAAVTESAPFRCVNRLFYRGYVISAFRPVYSQDEIDVHTATIGALDAALVDNGNRSTWDAFHNGFIGKMDFRGILGSGYCAF